MDEAVRRIGDFYRVYHSIRYVGDLTVFRLNRAVSGNTLEQANLRFRDILTGDITPSAPTEEETRKNEFLQLPRLVMRFNRRDYGRLLELIRFINTDGV